MPTIDRTNIGNHFGCPMPSITFKAFPVALHRALKTRAALNKRSLNQEVIAILEEKTAPSRKVDVEALIAEARRVRASLRFTISPEEIETLKREGRE
jgi:plasmid stability protein